MRPKRPGQNARVEVAAPASMRLHDAPRWIRSCSSCCHTGKLGGTCSAAQGPVAGRGRTRARGNKAAWVAGARLGRGNEVGAVGAAGGRRGSQDGRQARGDGDGLRLRSGGSRGDGVEQGTRGAARGEVDSGASAARAQGLPRGARERERGAEGEEARTQALRLRGQGQGERGDVLCPRGPLTGLAGAQ